MHNCITLEVRKYLDHQSAEKYIHALVHSHID